MSVKLNLGCGTKKREGWINVDSAPECKPDLLHDLTSPLPFEDQSVDEIVVDAVLEHFDKYARYFIMYDWTRVLKTGGKLTVGVPNFKKILFRYFKWRFDDLVDTIFGETMWGSQYYIGHFGSHKWGYSEKTLKEFLEQFGIGEITVSKHSLILEATGIKIKHVTFEQLKTTQIYSPNNACGEGRANMSLEEVKILGNFKTR